MNKDLIIKLENYLFEHKNKLRVAAYMMADFLGVMIGVKPAAINHLEAKELLGISLIEFNELLNQANLKALFFKQEYISMGKLSWVEDIYVSHDTKTAYMLHQAFAKLRSSMDDLGQTFDQKAWEESSREIGQLLGYPATAVEYFIAEQDIENKERQQLMDRYQFYVHSPKHHEEEYRAYDQKIFQAVRDYAPRTANILLPSKTE